jgi:hypothetical protein
MRRYCLLPALTFSLLSSACFFWAASVRLDPDPGSVKPLPAAGLHEVSYSVEVRDVRDLGDPRDLGLRCGVLFFQPRILSDGEPEKAVREAVLNQLRLRDMRIAPLGESDVHLRVRLLSFSCYALGGPVLLEMEGGKVVAHAEGDVEVINGEDGRLVRMIPVSARAEFNSMLLTARKYELTLNTALREFAARVVRHPDSLIAI